MKALVLSREGRKAVLLLPGGEMRTVRAKREWQTGMEVTVRPYPLRKAKRKSGLRAVWYPMVACAAAFVILFAGLRLAGRTHIDRQQPIEPLSSGAPAAVVATDEPTTEPAVTASPTPTVSLTPAPTPTPSPMPTSEPTAAPTVVVTVPPTPQPRCDECGQTGHDDDHCPYEVCDECGRTGHDDDDCPYEVCDECGRTGHDDDDCPERHSRGHHDD